jgi:hypothetical protein
VAGSALVAYDNANIQQVNREHAAKMFPAKVK